MSPDVATPTTDYQTLYDAFKLDVPEYFNFGFDVMDRWAEDRTKLALVSIRRNAEKAEHHTFFDLSRLSNRFAYVLRKLGLKKGDRVLVMLESISEWYVAMIGMIKLGVIPMPGTVLLTPKDIACLLYTSDAADDPTLV